MLHVITVDDRESNPNYGKPLFNPATVLAIPKMKVYGIRAYTYEDGYHKILVDVYDYADKNVFKAKEGRPLDDQLKELEKVKDRIALLTAHVYVIPKEVGLSQKKPIKLEIPITGGNVDPQISYAKSIIGKYVDGAEIISSGQYVDIAGITKGKGFEGPVKRFGIKRKQHKSRKTVREVGVIGPWDPSAVTYTVPRAGQHGFHQRIEYNHRVLMIGDGSENPVTPKGGFPHFGVVRGKYIIVRGSVPGPAKRPIVVRLPLRMKKGAKEAPKILAISTRIERGS
jgi:large subunit ribosomal protein L3